ncbi:MFS transporter (plasmid) [Rhodococcus opacus]|uniref:MFS transporter n=1 Tax=Rhodococcus opacus TaxID=37919 RepID=UPI0034D35438
MSSDEKSMPKALLILLIFSIVVEGALYSAIVPMLPFFTREFDLSDSAAGLLVSGYSAGLVAGSLLTVVVLRFIGVRNVMCAGLLAFSASTVAFAVSDTSTLLTTARTGQGLAAGVLSTACIFWLLDAAGPAQRGAVLGRALSYTFIGTIAGPLIGTVAVQYGIALSYSVVAVCCGLAAGLLARMPEPQDRRESERAPAYPTSHPRSTAYIGVWIVALVGALAGLTNLAGPLMLTRVGASDVFVGAVFVVASLATIVVGRVTGAVADGRGALLPLSVGLLVAIALLIVFGIEFGPILNGLIVMGLMVSVFVCFVPGGVLLTRGGEAIGWPLRFAIALSSTAWGIGETVGASATGFGLDSVGALGTYSIAAGIAVLSLGVAMWFGRRHGESQLRRADHVNVV